MNSNFFSFHDKNPLIIVMNRLISPIHDKKHKRIVMNQGKKAIHDNYSYYREKDKKKFCGADHTFQDWGGEKNL